MEKIICCECKIEVKSVDFLFRHLKKHKMTAEEYILKWVHNNIRPVCECGCGNITNWHVASRGFSRFVHGHHAFGRIKTDEEKRKIGEKNKINMKKWASENPEEARKRVDFMLSFRTQESEKKRIEATKSAYKNMSKADKKKFSDHAKKLWQNGTLDKAHLKASSTFKKRFAEGKYDFTERNNKISLSVTNKYLEGGFLWTIGEYKSIKTGVVCKYRSKWEFEFMKILDFEDKVSWWEYEPMFLFYFFEGVKRRYIPDFLIIIDGKKTLVEVKPDPLISTPMNSAKEEAARKICEKNGWRYFSWSLGEKI